MTTRNRLVACDWLHGGRPTVDRACSLLTLSDTLLFTSDSRTHESLRPLTAHHHKQQQQQQYDRQRWSRFGKTLWVYRKLHRDRTANTSCEKRLAGRRTGCPALTSMLFIVVQPCHFIYMGRQIGHRAICWQHAIDNRLQLLRCYRWRCIREVSGTVAMQFTRLVFTVTRCNWSERIAGERQCCMI